MTRVHVWGAAGYAAAEAARLIHAHPELELGILESRSHAGERVGAHLPLLRRTPYVFSPEGSVLSAIRTGDFVIAAAAHGEAYEDVPRFLDRGARVVDLSADYRFDERAVYGLAEWNRDAIASADLVANPGCYPTATLLALLPLLRVGQPLQIVVDAKSGITGAGRRPALQSLYAEVANEVRAYGLNGHRHQPEIERILAMHGSSVPLIFTPHVVPIARGLLADVYVTFASAPKSDEVDASYRDAYTSSRFVRIVTGDLVPSVSAVIGGNHAEIRADVIGHTVRAICAIDNLGKGAAGQAVQNINLMLGLPEDCGFHVDAVVA